jgi:hypothetical protein
MSEYGDLHEGHQNYDLDHAHQDHGNEHDHLNQYDAYGNQHAAELDEHYAHGHHVESDNPYQHYEEDDYTNADVHAAEYDSNFGEHAVEADHDSSFADLDALREHFDADVLSAHQYEGGGYEGGELSAVSK